MSDLTLDELTFLEHSNLIEGVSDSQSLDDAVRAWKYLRKQGMINVDVIEIVHRLLMKNHNLQPDELGQYRRCEVTIGGRFGLNFSLIPNAMDVWIDNVNLSPSHWQEHHVQFERIHPFVDGNGRTGRMFMNWERMRAGEGIVIIREEHRQDYYKWFK